MLSIVKKSGMSVLITALLSTQFMFAPTPKAYADVIEANVALGQATVTTNGSVTNAVSLGRLIDGDRQSSNYLLIDASGGPKWVQLDVGESFAVTRVNVLNDYNPTATRFGRDIIVQLSNDPAFASGVTTIFNNDADNTAGQGAGTDAVYLEPTDGSGKSIILGAPVNARYVRSWANGHTRAGDNSIQTVNTPVELAQRNPGLSMKFQVNQLATGTTYYFAVKTYDDAGNYSALPNVVSGATFTPVPDSVTVSSLSQLQQAVDDAPAGGRIITLAAGTYNQTSSIQITGKNNITIQGATTNYNDTVVAGPGINSTTLDINFKLSDSDYVTFKHLTIRDSYYHSIQINNGSDYFHADHVRTWDNGEGGIKSTSSGNLELPYSDYGLIENSSIGYSSSGLRGSVEGVT